MKELLKNLRKMESEELITRLNYNQKKYNDYFDLRYKYKCDDSSTNYYMNTYLTNINKIKKVLQERNLKINFLNGWEII